MVRTRAENTARRVVGAKAPRKQLVQVNPSSPGSKDKHSGGNPVRWTPTPSWQKGIGNFFKKSDAANSETSETRTPGQEPSSEIISVEGDNGTTSG